MIRPTRRTIRVTSEGSRRKFAPVLVLPLPSEESMSAGVSGTLSVPMAACSLWQDGKVQISAYKIN